MIKQKTANQAVEIRDRRIAKSIVVAYSCEITKVGGKKETYRVQSETDVSKFYVVKFMDGCPVFCQCADFLHRIKTNPNHICKHARAIVLAEQYGLISSKSDQQSKATSFDQEEYTF